MYYRKEFKKTGTSNNEGFLSIVLMPIQQIKTIGQQCLKQKDFQLLENL